MHVVDVGAGAGFFARAAGRLVGPYGRVWALDSNGELLARLKNLALAEGLQNVEVVRGNIEHIGGSHLPEGTFDYAIVANILFGAQDRGCLAAEVHRILKRHGRALLIDWAGSFGGLGPHPDHVVSKVAGVDVFVEAGFTYGSDVPAGQYHWGVIMRKKS
jgi:ubiquinone/menaquinone biosynthesis C-methylase UbiE